MHTPLTNIAPALALCAAVSTACGQAIYTESFAFKTIPILESEGWIFRNQSDNPRPGEQPWKITGYNGPDGSPYIQSDSWPFFKIAGDRSSTWAVMPEIPGMTAGADIKFETVMYWSQDRSDTLELRYSPSGGSSTGSSSTDVGDFTQVLWTHSGNGIQFWTPYNVEAPGSGRLAFRYRWDDTASTYGGIAQVDAIVITGTTPSGPPLPQPGQTVFWTAAMSPIHFNAGDTIIPAGGTVVVDPGVTVRVDAPGRLVVEGMLKGMGTQAAPIQIQGIGNTGIHVAGEAEFTFAQISGKVGREGTGFVLFTDCTILPSGDVAGVGGRHSAASFERCTIQTDYFEPWGHVAFRDCSFTGSYFGPVNYTYIQGLTSSAPVELRGQGQTRYVDGLNISGVGNNGGAVELTGSIDYLLGPNCNLTGNSYPVWITGGGLHPDSHIPLTGNTNNAIRADGANTALRHNRVTWPNLGVPYHFLSDATYSGGVHIAPGATLKFGASGGLLFYGTQGNHNIRGLPGQPIRFERLNPTHEWLSIGLGGGVNLLEHLDISGAGLGLSGPQSTNFLRDSVISNCARGTQPSGQGFFYVIGTTYLNNGIGVKGDSSPGAAGTHSGFLLDGAERGNIFAGNTVAAESSPAPGGAVATLVAPNNWWNHPTGPNSPWYNPGGQGDPVSFAVEVLPFRTEPPNLADTPPVVRLTSRHYPIVLPGEKIFLQWEASDDHGIVSQDILLDTRGGGIIQFLPVATGLPGTQRAYELTIPDVGIINDARHCMVRIAATDTAGNTSFEQVELYIPNAAPGGQVSFITPVAQGFRPHEEVTICYNAMNMVNNGTIYFDLSADERWQRGISAPAGLNRCTLLPVRFPAVSTDRARLAIRAAWNANYEEWYYSDCFEIRPDSRLGDAPPTIELTGPAHGQQFTGGGVIPITWTASDDEGLRSFKIQYSTTSGYNWHTLAMDIPGTARRYDWQLPASDGIPDLRIRVVAIDHRFQNSADGDDRSLVVNPGSGPAPCYANCDQSTIAPILNVDDFTCFINEFAQAQSLPHEQQIAHYANCDSSTTAPVLNVDDFTCFIDEFAQGCP